MTSIVEIRRDARKGRASKNNWYKRKAKVEKKNIRMVNSRSTVNLEFIAGL